MNGLRVVAAGPLTTVQDAGRWAWQASGVSPAGWADPWLGWLANALLDQDDAHAGLEWTAAGDTLQVVGDAPVRVAVAAWAAVRVDGHPVPAFRSLRLWPGQVLEVGALTHGRHGVLAVQGGVQTALVLGSRSAHVRTGVGGTALAAGAYIPVGADPMPGRADQGIPPDRVPLPKSLVRVVAGPQLAWMAPNTLTALETGSWHVRAADRMGVRLAGPGLHVTGAQPVSEGVVTGAVQVPDDGQPIVLGVDRQTMGGYVKPVTILHADLRHAAQWRPGQSVQFRVVSLAEADQARLDDATVRTNVRAQLAPVVGVQAWESPRLLNALR